MRAGADHGTAQVGGERAAPCSSLTAAGSCMRTWRPSRPKAKSSTASP